MSVNDGTIEGRDKNSGDINGKDMQQREQQVQYKEIYQPRDSLDSEIKNIRMLMVRMSQKRHEGKMNIYTRIASNNKRHMTEEDCKSKASRALQQKIWKQEN